MNLRATVMKVTFEMDCGATACVFKMMVQRVVLSEGFNTIADGYFNDFVMVEEAAICSKLLTLDTS